MSDTAMIRLILPLLLLFAALPAQALELVMFESRGCAYCRQWHEEVGDAYPRTAEGKAAPLRRVDLADPRPQDLSAIGGIVFTPTFVLLGDDGREVGRIQGYPGEDFFWPLLADLIGKARP